MRKLEEPMRLLVPTLLLVAALPAAAHHPFTPYCDAARPVTVTGTIAELRIINPHVVLIVDVQEPDARTSRWGFE